MTKNTLTLSPPMVEEKFDFCSSQMAKIQLNYPPSSEKCFSSVCLKWITIHLNCLEKIEFCLSQMAKNTLQ